METRAIKANAASIVFPTLTSFTSRWDGTIPGTASDFTSLAGDLFMNPVVAIGLQWIANTFSSPTLTLSRGRGKGKGKPIPSHPVLDLLGHPNPCYDASNLMHAVCLSDKVAGNAYLLKVRDGHGLVRELYYLYHDYVHPVSGEGQFISYYEYRTTWGNPVVRYAPEDIIHIRNGLDPHDPRLGMSPLRAILKEIVGDNAASTYTAGLLQNGGAVPFIVQPGDGDSTIDPESASDIKRKLSNVSGDGAGDPVVFSERVRVDKVGSSPEEMLLDKIRRYPEDRIAAAMGLNTIALGLTSGAGSKTFANYEQAILACYYSCLMPLQNRILDALNANLVPEFDGSGSLVLAYDYSDVSALQEDQDALANRTTNLYASGLITRDEGRALLGLDPIGGDPVFTTDATPATPIPTNTNIV